MRFFDAHCHIQFDPYDSDREALLRAMGERGVGGVVVGCDLESSRKALALAEGTDFLYASVGLHPNHEADEWFDPVHYRKLAQSAKVVAVGECGLDYYRLADETEEVKTKQKNILNDQLKLAAELDKPLILHSRPSKGTMDAYHDLIELLKAAKETYPNLRGDVHFFVGGIPEMRAITALGFTVSYTAVITFARDYDEVIRTAPLSALLSETDAPYVAPASRRGERNDPLAVMEVVAKIAEIRGEDAGHVREALLFNSLRLFDISS